MKLLLDEMYAGLKEYFEVLGWKVLTIQELGLQGIKDMDVANYAKANDLLIITQDQKTADIADLLKVRNLLISNAMIANTAHIKILKKYPELNK